MIRYDVLHPIKAQVLKELGKALDDKKRNVRKEAVDCRARWCVLLSGCVPSVGVTALAPD